MASPVCIYGNPALRTKSVRVETVTDDTRVLVDRMFGIMYSAEGIGLAAEQIGHTEAVFVLDVPAQADQDEKGLPHNPGVAMPQAFINPEIIGASDETAVAEEGCLSFPKLYVSVTRSAEVVVRFLDRNGNEQVINAKGLLARAIQHELDHLNGVLLVDHMSSVAKLKHALLLRKFRKENKATE
jgi:peptide deformylase